MKLHFLGTGAGVPSANRNVSSIALSLVPENGQVWLFDVGEGTQHQIRSSPLKPRLITRIFVTHLHGDHLFGLPGMLSSRSFSSGHLPDVDIYGPPGIEEYLETSLRVSTTHLSFAVHCHEVSTGEIMSADGFRVTAIPMDHVVQSFGYRIEEDPLPGELQVNRLLAAGVAPGPAFGELKAGRTVKIGGRLIDGSEFLGPARAGRIVAYTGDTRPTPAAVELAQNADVFIHESTYGPQYEELASRFGHSTATQAAQIAREAGVDRLVLTHFSARYSPQGVEELLAVARKIFPPTIAVYDFDELSIPSRHCFRESPPA